MRIFFIFVTFMASSLFSTSALAACGQRMESWEASTYNLEGSIAMSDSVCVNADLTEVEIENCDRHTIRTARKLARSHPYLKAEIERQLIECSRD